jgi:hypothetical protein
MAEARAGHVTTAPECTESRSAEEGQPCVHPQCYGMRNSLFLCLRPRHLEVVPDSVLIGPMGHDSADGRDNIEDGRPMSAAFDDAPTTDVLARRVPINMHALIILPCEPFRRLLNQQRAHGCHTRQTVPVRSYKRHTRKSSDRQNRIETQRTHQVQMAGRPPS